ncbi:MAG: adenylate/guanylate cyclase domain-containing protein [Deltaproteobacteria bacterium]|nr:adenylate/guanylate cyclase domain-containing protein [Deltaproteobacteria bacterium]
MQFFKKLIAPAGWKIGLLVTCLSLVIYGAGIPFFHLMELKAYDLHFTSRGRIATLDRVVIAAIDEKSITALGRWPWPRTRLAALVQRLKEAGASVAAFDIVFSEPDETGGLAAIKELKKRLGSAGDKATRTISGLEKLADNDAALAKTIKENLSVVLGHFFFLSKEEAGAAPADDRFIANSAFNLIRPIDESNAEPKYVKAFGVVQNIPVISRAATEFAAFNIIPDVDGAVRWAPLAIEFQESVYPHLSIAAVKKYNGSPPLTLNIAAYGVDSIDVGKLHVPTEERGQMLINFRGPARTFPHYSIADILNGEVPASALKGKIVVVGATATGIYDMRTIPFPGVFPGVEVHANIIDNMLAGDFIRRPDWVILFDVLAMLIPGVILSIIIPRLRPLFTALITFALSGVYVFFNGYMFTYLGYWVAEVYPLFNIYFVAGSVTVFQYITEEKKKRAIKGAFSQYVSPSLVNEILKDPDKLSLGGEEIRMTVLFSDIRGFTTISEGLKPKVLVKLMNDYLTPMTDIVLKNGGTIDKYMGDAIMAFWNAPIPQEDHYMRACRTALEMLKRLRELQIEWEKAGIPKIDIGIGISTGKAVVGNMGSTMRFDYTVIGDMVNLGSRLEGLNKEYGTSVIVPKFTALDVKEEFVIRELDYVRVKGKDKPIQIFELVDYRPGNDRVNEAVQRFEAGLRAYRRKDWDEAEGQFNAALSMRPEDKPSQVYLSRVKNLRDAHLPEDWDGVYVMTKK